jgi:hypothetical protein
MLLSDIEGSPEGANCLVEDKALSVPLSGKVLKKSIIDCLYWRISTLTPLHIGVSFMHNAQHWRHICQFADVPWQ